MAEVSRLPERQAQPFTPPAERRVVARLNQIPDAQLACRVHHRWPSEELEFGKPLPEGLTAQRTETRGVYLLEDQCPRCGKIRWKMTLPDHVFDTGEGWHYIDPHGLPGYDDWVKLDADMERGSRVMLRENIRRNASRIFR